MRFHAQYCGVCKTETLFIEKLVDPMSDTCTEMEDVCLKCDNKFFVKDKLKIKI